MNLKRFYISEYFYTVMLHIDPAHLHINKYIFLEIKKAAFVETEFLLEVQGFLRDPSVPATHEVPRKHEEKKEQSISEELLARSQIKLNLTRCELLKKY